MTRADWEAPWQALPALRHAFRVTDPEELGALSPRGVQHRMTLLGRGAYEASRWRSASPAMVASRGHTRLAVTHRTGTGHLAFFTFVADDDPPSVMHGRHLPPGTLAWCRAEAEIHSQSPANATWSNLCFPAEMVEQDWHALYRTGFTGPRGSVAVVPAGPDVQRQLAAGIDAALSAGEHAPTLVHGLLRLLLDCFVTRPGAAAGEGDRRMPRGLARQVRVVDGLVAIADAADAPFPLSAVCARLGVSLRTLNASSNTVLGMGAGRYLRRRRLHRVLAALRQGGVSVTQAATAQGFWDLGRFAGDYRALFGCPPSETLRQAAGPRDRLVPDEGLSPACNTQRPAAHVPQA